MSEPVRQGETVAARRFGPFPATAVARYAAASNDDNPLHTDPSLAAKAGLARPPIHGMLIMGCFEPYLAGWRSEVVLRKLTAKFIRPVLVDEAIEISGKVVRAGQGQAAVLRLTVKRQSDGGAASDLVCLAEAFVDPWRTDP